MSQLNIFSESRAFIVEVSQNVDGLTDDPITN
jgi:hypothetical protein